MTSKLTNKGHANRRPAVCKESEPSDCNYGFIELQLLAITDDPLKEITFVGTVTIEGEDTPSTLDAEWQSNKGTVVAPSTIQPGQAFFPVVSGLNEGDNVVLYVKATDPRGCTYRGTAAATFEASGP